MFVDCNSQELIGYGFMMSLKCDRMIVKHEHTPSIYNTSNAKVNGFKEGTNQLIGMLCLACNS